MANQHIQIRLDISAEQFRRYYAGTAQYVQVQSLDGRSVRFPAEVLRPHVTPEGVHGVFTLVHDRHNRFIGLYRIGDMSP